MRKLGKLPARRDPRTLKLRHYLSASRLPSVPDSIRWSAKVPRWPMYLNDQIGCCAIAGPAHQIQAWTANDGKQVTPTDGEVIMDYSRIGGYKPDNPATDNGCVLLDVMNAWRNRGICNRRIGGFASVNPLDHQLVCAAIYLFGGLCIGLDLPAACDGMDVWKAPSRFHQFGKWAKGSWGGHCVELVDYDHEFLTCVTWGALKRISWAFFDSYCDEAFAAIAADWLGPDNKAPNGFDSAALVKDLTLLR